MRKKIVKMFGNAFWLFTLIMGNPIHKPVFQHLHLHYLSHNVQITHDNNTIVDGAVWIFCKFSWLIWVGYTWKCEKVPNYPMLKKVKKKSCIQNMIRIMIIIDRLLLVWISNILSNFENDWTKTVTARVWTDRHPDRQTDKHTYKRNEPTYLRFSQVIIYRDMMQSVGCHNVSEAGLRVFNS